MLLCYEKLLSNITIGSAFFISLAILSSNGAITSEPQTAELQLVNHAKTLYGQHKPTIPELREAAKTGNAEAQFYLGEASQDNHAL